LNCTVEIAKNLVHRQRIEQAVVLYGKIGAGSWELQYRDLLGGQLKPWAKDSLIDGLIPDSACVPRRRETSRLLQFLLVIGVLRA